MGVKFPDERLFYNRTNSLLHLELYAWYLYEMVTQNMSTHLLGEKNLFLVSSKALHWSNKRDYSYARIYFPTVICKGININMNILSTDSAK